MLARIVWCLVLLLPASFAAQAGDEFDTPRWRELSRLMFGDRVIQPGVGRVAEVLVNARADDAALVPVMIRTHVAQTPERFIKHLWLVIDHNPSPFGVRFNLTPESGKADIETRVRFENSSPIRVIAELNDGSLWMNAKLVTGAGGCSSPGAKNDLAMRNLGKLKFTVEEQFASEGDPLLAQLRVSHPQFTGLGSDNPEPARFIREVKVFYADKLVLSADLDFTISENPNFRFYFQPTGKGELRAEVVDTTDLRVEQTLDFDPARVMLR